MKYWRKPDGTCGTYDDDGFVPDSEEVDQATYDAWVAAQPVPEPEPDLKVEYKKLTDDNARIKFIAKKLGFDD
ncbi:hypothetical protein J2755_000677 [Methanohalophilus levihalophilus]|uniref:hypothetical protein n=1 Tax=Methanohalophilus levihalophilus TaxID=1431282 RepID=UPI001AE24792|nr:hypothetical protein [Methanohalophilus levihalophilus]MBP2029757.1 hypothetical protein [Methanohalophilus levihalophilus]